MVFLGKTIKLIVIAQKNIMNLDFITITFPFVIVYIVNSLLDAINFSVFKRF